MVIKLFVSMRIISIIILILSLLSCKAFQPDADPVYPSPERKDACHT